MQESAKSSPLRWLTASSPTNHNMLLFRTLNRELNQPNANEDVLAPLLRDKLMPARMWWLTRIPGALKRFHRVLEHKRLGVPGCCNFVDSRTSWFDRVVAEAVSTHGISQVVVVAAGFDTRAYRLGAKHEGVRFYEVDLPHASSKKQELVRELLQPSYPRPTFLAADLSTQPLDAVLLSAATGTATAATTSASGSSSKSKFDPSLPTLFTVEGLIYYLPEAAVRALFASMLRVAAPGSRVAFDFLHQQVLDGSVPNPPAYKVTAQSVANKGEPFISGIPNSKEGVASFLDSTVPQQGSAAPLQAAAVLPEMPAAAAAAAATGTDTASGSGKVGVWRVADFLGPREMVAQQLPHLTYDEQLPPILSFYSFATAEVVVAADDA